MTRDFTSCSGYSTWTNPPARATGAPHCFGPFLDFAYLVSREAGVTRRRSAVFREAAAPHITHYEAPN